MIRLSENGQDGSATIAVTKLPRLAGALGDAVHHALSTKVPQRCVVNLTTQVYIRPRGIVVDLSFAGRFEDAAADAMVLLGLADEQAVMLAKAAERCARMLGHVEDHGRVAREVHENVVS